MQGEPDTLVVRITILSVWLCQQTLWGTEERFINITLILNNNSCGCEKEFLEKRRRAKYAPTDQVWQSRQFHRQSKGQIREYFFILRASHKKISFTGKNVSNMATALTLWTVTFNRVKEVPKSDLIARLGVGGSFSKASGWLIRPDRRVIHPWERLLLNSCKQRRIWKMGLTRELSQIPLIRVR